jgi:hypothetical protein
MRVIFNIHSNLAAKAAGWRAREIHIQGQREAALDEILNAVQLIGNTTMYEYIIEKGLVGKDWLLYVNGVTISGQSSHITGVKDNTQIHLMDNHA